MADEQRRVQVPEDEDYRESEDEDFDPNAADDHGISSSSDDEDQTHQNEDISEGISWKRKVEPGQRSGSRTNDDEGDEVTGEGIRILTRSQRIAEEAQQKTTSLSGSRATIDTDAVWASLRGPASSEGTASAKEDDMITITETYEFAKNIITKEKKVPRNSSEGQAYLKEQEVRESQPPGHIADESSTVPTNNGATQSVTKPTLKGGPRKRKGSSLEAMAAKSKPTKLNTLEKSKLDWQGFVEEQGIEDDLRRHNKGGYLHKQDFLSRVEEKRFADLKEGQKALKKH
ncbi:bucentaur or craniofacial development-domain-containing protein [Lipomyces kononenkoae]|uniref:Bucentaur or craniofacial development-domain-containing protein n=1 Tax=Lipomyces kononenkoae TaxID=34357 RepID=A0ACC3SVU4_LIPKO